MLSDSPSERETAFFPKKANKTSSQRLLLCPPAPPILTPLPTAGQQPTVLGCLSGRSLSTFHQKRSLIHPTNFSSHFLQRLATCVLITRVKGMRKLWGGGAATSHGLSEQRVAFAPEGTQQPNNANICPARAAMC